MGVKEQEQGGPLRLQACKYHITRRQQSEEKKGDGFICSRLEQPVGRSRVFVLMISSSSPPETNLGARLSRTKAERASMASSEHPPCCSFTLRGVARVGVTGRRGSEKVMR